MGRVLYTALELHHLSLPLPEGHQSELQPEHILLQAASNYFIDTDLIDEYQNGHYFISTQKCSSKVLPENSKYEQYKLCSLEYDLVWKVRNFFPISQVCKKNPLLFN